MEIPKWENKTKAIKPLNLRIQDLNEMKTNFKIYHPPQNSTMDHQPELNKLSKTKTHSITFQEKTLNIPSHTDKPKHEMKVVCSTIF